MELRSEVRMIFFFFASPYFLTVMKYEFIRSGPIVKPKRNP